MRKLLTRMVVTSIVFILLCTTAIAQDGKNTRSVTNDDYGVTLSEYNVTLSAGSVKTISITSWDGFDNPKIVYGSDNYVIGHPVTTTHFTAELTGTGSPYTLVIRAKDYVNGEKTENLYISVDMILEKRGDMNKKTRGDGGAGLSIKVVPRLGKN